MPDDFSRSWVDYEDHLDLEALDDLEARMQARSEAGSASQAVDALGAAGDATTADDAAFAEAEDALPAEGGVIRGGPGKSYRLTEPWVPSKPVIFRGAGPGATTLYIDHDVGEGVWIQKSWQGVEYVTVEGSPDRTAASPGSNTGVRWEPPDVADADAMNMTFIRQVEIKGHPLDGFAGVAHGPTKVIDQVRTINNGRFGTILDNGISTGRTNLLPAAAGFWTVLLTSSGNGGQDLVIGHPDEDSMTDTTDEEGVPVSRVMTRVDILQIDAAKSMEDPTVWIDGTTEEENIWIRGYDVHLRLGGVRGSPTIWGQDIIVESMRNVGVKAGTSPDAFTHCVKLIASPVLPTRGILIRNMHPISRTVDPAVVIDDSNGLVDGYVIQQPSRSGITTLYTPGKPVPRPGGAVSSQKPFTIPDDRAAYFAFDEVVGGKLDLSCVDTRASSTASAGGSGAIGFRVGDGQAFAERRSVLVTGSPTLTTGTGSLAGTTGTDGELTVKALASLTNEVQQVRLDATDGDINLTFNAHTTSNFGFDAGGDPPTARQMREALEALTDFVPGDIVVTGGGGGAPPYRYTVRLRGAYANPAPGSPLGLITATGVGLSGGGSAVTTSALGRARLYIENRTGASRDYVWTLSGIDESVTIQDLVLA